MAQPHGMLAGFLLLLSSSSYGQREAASLQRNIEPQPGEPAGTFTGAQTTIAGTPAHGIINKSNVRVSESVMDVDKNMTPSVFAGRSLLQGLANRAGGRERRSLMDKLQTAECMAGNEQPKNGLPVARVAIALYGLFRHDCGSYNFDGVFLEPLKASKKFTYVVDVLLHANIAVHEEGDRSKIKGHHTNTKLHMPSLMFLSFNPCKFDVTDQDVVDGSIQPLLNQTCLRYGEYHNWAAGSPTRCATTKNYYRALWSQNNVANLIKQHEKKSGINYDVVVVARPDVMFTAPMIVDHFDTVVDAGRSADPVQMLFTPTWATYHGYNDRFMFGHGGPVLNALERINGLVEYAEKGPTDHRVHSETYMAWTINGYFDKIRKNGLKGELKKSKGIRFRRVRADGALVNNQYNAKHVNPQPIDFWEVCDEDKLAELFPVTGDEKRKRTLKHDAAKHANLALPTNGYAVDGLPSTSALEAVVKDQVQADRVLKEEVEKAKRQNAKMSEKLHLANERTHELEKIVDKILAAKNPTKHWWK